MNGVQHNYPNTKKDESLRNFHWCLIRTLHNYPFSTDWKSISVFLSIFKQKINISLRSSLWFSTVGMYVCISMCMYVYICMYVNVYTLYIHICRTYHYPFGSHSYCCFFPFSFSIFFYFFLHFSVGRAQFPFLLLLCVPYSFISFPSIIYFLPLSWNRNPSRQR